MLLFIYLFVFFFFHLNIFGFINATFKLQNKFPIKVQTVTLGIVEKLFFINIYKPYHLIVSQKPCLIYSQKKKMTWQITKRLFKLSLYKLRNKLEYCLCLLEAILNCSNKFCNKNFTHFKTKTRA